MKTTIAKGSYAEQREQIEKLKKEKAMSHPVKISIDDGHVEYTYVFNCGDTHSIHTLLGMICATLGIATPPHGELRDRREL